MTLLADFKTTIGVSGTDNDQYYIDYYLKTAIDRATVLSTNIKEVEVTLSSGTQTYDLTSSSVASPVVGSAGIQDLVFDGTYENNYLYKRDYYLSSPTTLYFVDGDDVISGSYSFKYNAYFSKPTTGESATETDMPTLLFPAVIKYAQALYRMDQMSGGDGSGAISSKSEDGLSVAFGDIGTMIQDQLKMAETMMITSGARSRFNFFSGMII